MVGDEWQTHFTCAQPGVVFYGMQTDPRYRPSYSCVLQYSVYGYRITCKLPGHVQVHIYIPHIEKDKYAMRKKIPYM